MTPTDIAHLISDKYSAGTKDFHFGLKLLSILVYNYWLGRYKVAQKS